MPEGQPVKGKNNRKRDEDYDEKESQA